MAMLKSAKYWRAFTAATRAEAEAAAASWWSEQSGFDKVSGWTLPAESPASGAPHWTATIIYRPSNPENSAAGGARPTVH
jgi:hypothetical protein